MSPLDVFTVFVLLGGLVGLLAGVVLAAASLGLLIKDWIGADDA